MAEAARTAMHFCGGREQHELGSDTMLRMALLQQLEAVVGVASKDPSEG